MRGGGGSHLGVDIPAAFTRTGACAVALACVALPAWAEESLATRSGWEAGVQLSRYHYEEPGTMWLEGTRLGASGAYTAVTPRRTFARLEGRLSYGKLDYHGSGVLTNAPDYIVEVRALAGRDYAAGSAFWSPYAGAGFRYLYNDLRGVTSTGAIGYRRESNYFYVPVGVTLRVPLREGWVLAPQIEYDVFVRGVQRSYLSDTGLGLGDASNQQDSGSGYRVQLMFEGARWAISPWMHYWKVKDSDLQPVGLGVVVYEPANWTREAGLELRYRF
jgi:Outer membrane protein beta-barrel domain